MANSTSIHLLLFLFLSCAANSMSAATLEQADAFVLSSKPVSRALKEKQSHFRFYWHDITSGPNPTSIPVAAAPESKKSSTYFGTMVMIDDPLTTGPDMKSKLVGRAQGLYAMAGIEKLEIIMAMNFVFTDGKYNGSTIAILGHNAVNDPVREMPIVGGSGLFRFARGYVQAKTYSLMKTEAVVEYNIFVNHY
jgi:Dirigent-like protein